MLFIKLRTLSRGLIRDTTDRTLMGRDLKTQRASTSWGTVLTLVKNFWSLTFMLARMGQYYKIQKAAWEVSITTSVSKMLFSKKKSKGLKDFGKIPSWE